MKINTANVANPSSTESVLWRVRPGVALLAPMPAKADTTGLSHGALSTTDAPKRFAKDPARHTESPQSRGNPAHT